MYVKRKCFVCKPQWLETLTIVVLEAELAACSLAQEVNTVVFLGLQGELNKVQAVAEMRTWCLVCHFLKQSFLQICKS